MAEEIHQQILTGERALFASRDLAIFDSIFEDGESPLKESRDITLSGCMFRWKYPLWYCDHVDVQHSSWFDTARAGVWYTNDIRVRDCVIDAPKNFRRCRGLTLEQVTMSRAEETLWHCADVTMRQVSAQGDYFAMNTENVTAEDFTLIGNYPFDGARNVTIQNARMLSKDAFWNTEHVTVKDSFVSGEYLGWNAKDLTFENCTLESLQGLCYIDRLVMRHCKLINTTLAFEYSTVEAEITGRIDSVLNPTSGTITADTIDELIIEPDRVDPAKTKIICRT